MSAEDCKSNLPRPSRRARDLPPHVRSDLSVKPGVSLVQLSRNESALRPPAAWLDAAMQAVHSSAAYPDPEYKALRKAIAETFALDPQRIFCSAGLMEGLQSIALAYLDPGDAVVIPEHGFVFFRHIAEFANAEVKLAPEQNLRVDTGSILRVAEESAKMVIFANPGNPTGTYIGKDAIRELHSELPSGTLLVIDEAYAEFVSDDLYEPLFDLTDAGNVVVLRSFSKMYGLAGCRVGWGYSSASVVEHLRRIQVPAIVSSVSQSVAAVAIRDQAYVHSFKQIMLAVKRRFVDSIANLERISVLESEANFVLLRTRSASAAGNLDAFLRQRGIVLRRQSAVGLGDCLRTTIGTEEQMTFVASALMEWCGQEC